MKSLSSSIVKNTSKYINLFVPSNHELDITDRGHKSVAVAVA